MTMPGAGSYYGCERDIYNDRLMYSGEQPLFTIIKLESFVCSALVLATQNTPPPSASPAHLFAVLAREQLLQAVVLTLCLRLCVEERLPPPPRSYTPMGSYRGEQIFDDNHLWREPISARPSPQPMATSSGEQPMRFKTPEVI